MLSDPSNAEGGHQQRQQSDDNHQHRKFGRADKAIILLDATSLELREFVNGEAKTD